MRRVFNNGELETVFRKQGYVSVPFMNAAELIALKEELQSLQPSDSFKGQQETEIGKQTFHVTFFDKDVNYKQQVFDLVRLKFKNIAQRLLNNYVCAQANVFLKQPHSGFVYPHQNLTITDETNFTSVSFWMPLQDTDIENGTICLVPGSQNDFVKYRNTHIYWPYVKFFKEGKGLNYFKPISVKAGDLLIIDDRIIHYTPINTSSIARWVLHALWKPAEAPLWFCNPDKDKVEIYEVNDSFWQFHLPGTMPTKNFPVKTITNTEIIYSEKELEKKLEFLKKGFE